MLVEGVRLLGEVRKNFKQINADSEKTLFFYISWATIFGNLVTNRLVHALLCSDVHARAQHAVAKSLKNGPPKKKRPTERLFSALLEPIGTKSRTVLKSGPLSRGLKVRTVFLDLVNLGKI